MKRIALLFLGLALCAGLAGCKREYLQAFWEGVQEGIKENSNGGDDDGGKNTQVDANRTFVCPHCSGQRSCPYCRGSVGGPLAYPCSYCSGRRICDICEGSGELPQSCYENYANFRAQSNGVIYVDCSSCQGTGVCPICRGANANSGGEWTFLCCNRTGRCPICSSFGLNYNGKIPVEDRGLPAQR